MAQNTIHLPPELDSVSKLTTMLSNVIQQFTAIEAMTIEDITTALAFTTGYCIGNRPADDQKRWDTKALRLMAVGRLDKGIQTAIDNRGENKIIMPAENANRISLVKP